VAQTRLDALDCARVIVFGCLQRDFCKTGTSDGDICVNVNQFFGRYTKSVRVDSPIRETLQASKRDVAAHEPSLASRSAAATIFSVLACGAVGLWFVALLAMHG
jgi:hypothetical protein